MWKFPKNCVFNLKNLNSSSVGQALGQTLRVQKTRKTSSPTAFPFILMWKANMKPMVMFGKVEGLIRHVSKQKDLENYEKDVCCLLLFESVLIFSLFTVSPTPPPFFSSLCLYKCILISLSFHVRRRIGLEVYSAFCMHTVPTIVFETLVLVNLICHSWEWGLTKLRRQNDIHIYLNSTVVAVTPLVLRRQRWTQ